jgi:signal peptidase II
MEDEKAVLKGRNLKIIWIGIVILAVVIDRITKYLIVQNIDLNSSITIMNKFFYITNIRNRGAAWGILQDSRLLFIPLTIAVSIFLIYIIIKSENKVLKTALSLILGGAVGNLIDRIADGGVVDFLHFYIGSYSYPIFNAADCCVVVGTFILAYYILFVYKEEDKKWNEKSN